MTIQTAESLKDAHRGIRDSQPESLRIRIHRAISWLARAEQEPHAPDARFLFLWVAFNAAYASEFGFEQAERDKARHFVATLLSIDVDRQLQQALHTSFSGPIRTLIENKFVFEPFWKALREHDSSGRWSESFKASKRVALKALMEGDTETVLSVVLDRLHTLRNQIVHGGATWNSSTNRLQVVDASRILGSILPIMLGLMIEARDEAFGPIAYPVLSS